MTHSLKEFQHSGIKGMRWGVRKKTSSGTGSIKSKSKSKASKLDNHPSLIKHGKKGIQNGRKLRAQLDVHHIDPKTGKYTHQTKTAKTVRTIDKTLQVGKAIVITTASVLAP